MADRLVVEGGLVLTGPDWEPQVADILVETGRITAVDRPGAFAAVDAARLSAVDRLVIPGMINAHTHSHTAVARGAARTWTLEASLLNGGWMAADRSAELAELCAVLAATELLASGCTGAFDLMAQAGGPDPAGLHAAACGYHAAGLRAVLAPMASDRSVHEAVPVIGGCCGVSSATVRTEDVIAACARFIDDFPALPGVEPAVAPTIPAHCSPDLVSGLHELAVRHDLRVHTHLAESKPQAISGAEHFGHSITRELARLNVLDDRLTVAHAIWVDDDDRRLLADAGAVAVTVPGSNLRLGSGVADTRGLLESGVRLAVGTDGANSADAFDMLDATRLTALMSRVWSRPDTEWLTVEETLEAATVGGAVACGWSDVGRIAAGWAADLVLLDLGSRAFAPCLDPANQLLTAARAADVTDVLVAGRHVLRDRMPVGVNVAAALDRFRELTDELHVRTVGVRERAAGEVAAAGAGLAALRRREWPVERLLAQ